MGVWQKRLGSWARWSNIQIKVNRTQVHEQMGNPVQKPHCQVHLSRVKGHVKTAVLPSTCLTFYSYLGVKWYGPMT